MNLLIRKFYTDRSCIGCRSCEKVCPQRIEISEMMKDFSGMIGM